MKSSINLLPKRGPEDKEEEARKRKIFLLAGSVVCIAFLAWLGPFILLQNAQAKQRTILSQIDTTAKNIEGLSETAHLYKNIFNKATAANSIVQKHNSFLAMVGDAKALVSTGVGIKNITISNANMKMAVIGNDMGSIIGYVRQLEENRPPKLFKTLAVSSITAGNTGGYEVKIEGVFSHEQ